MTNLTPEQIKAAVLKGLKEVADRFAKDPTPTDGTIHGIATPPRVRSSRRSPKKSASRKRTRGH